MQPCPRLSLLWLFHPSQHTNLLFISACLSSGDRNPGAHLGCSGGTLGHIWDAQEGSGRGAQPEAGLEQQPGLEAGSDASAAVPELLTSELGFFLLSL